MAYTINKSDGTILTTVPDGQIDDFTTNITFIGKNYSGFGESLNENFVKLLENFSGTSRPTNPVRGQLWYDTEVLKIKVYNGTDFVPVSSSVISDIQPLSLNAGDLWYNNISKQLYFYDGNGPLLLGPAYSESQGLSGFKVESILDIQNQTRVVTYLYNNGILLGIFSKDSFTPKTTIEGFQGNIVVGFNAANISNFKLNATATNADKLGTLSADNYVSKLESSTINGQLILSSNLGLTIGERNQGIFQISNSDLVVSNIETNGKIVLNVRRGVSSETAFSIDSTNRVVDIYKGFLDSEMQLGGNLVVNGDLFVNGTTTSTNVDDLVVEDKTIELASVETPSDVLADGAGIIVKGTTDHSLLWFSSSNSWNSTEHINLDSGNKYKINNVTVLDSDACYVSSFPNLSQIGTQTSITVGPDSSTIKLTLENNRISSSVTDEDLELSPNGNGNVSLIGSPKITGLADPTSSQDAATKEYVDSTVELRSLAFSIDISDGLSNTGIAGWLDQIAPASEYREGTIARILCSTQTNSTTNLDLNPLISLTTETFVTPTGTADAVTNASIATATVSAPTINISREVKIFQIQSGVWVFVS